jgi:hypothetical protein
MGQRDILEEIKKLNTADRLSVVEAALRLIREDLRGAPQSVPGTHTKEKLIRAAEALLPEYKAGGELTAFTVLDSEDLCAKG